MQYLVKLHKGTLNNEREKNHALKSNFTRGYRGLPPASEGATGPSNGQRRFVVAILKLRFILPVLQIQIQLPGNFGNFNDRLGNRKLVEFGELP